MLTKELKWGYLAILSETDLEDSYVRIRLIPPNSDHIKNIAINLDDWRKLNQFVEENVGEVT